MQLLETPINYIVVIVIAHVAVGDYVATLSVSFFGQCIESLCLVHTSTPVATHYEHKYSTAGN